MDLELPAGVFDTSEAPCENRWGPVTLTSAFERVDDLIAVSSRQMILKDTDVLFFTGIAFLAIEAVGAVVSSSPLKSGAPGISSPSRPCGSSNTTQSNGPGVKSPISGRGEDS